MGRGDLATLLILIAVVCPARAAAAEALGHPRLYMSGAEVDRLRALRTEGVRSRIWNNIRQSADWCLTRQPRGAWIAPVEPDPIYENLYDRFYAIMADLAITEHLGFAYALSGEAHYGLAARDWVLASSRAWRREGDGAPDGSKAYAVSRLLKGLAVGYDLAWDRFTKAERDEVRATLVSIGQKYFDGYFSTPTIAGPTFHTHHAIVEWGSFGVAALALLGEVPEAEAWLAATEKKFTDHLLPNGLAPDGAHVEGATFWASTMHYRLFFMDALRRVTGRDLFTEHAESMNADLALATIAARRTGGYHQHHANVVLEPSYGQLDYYAPVLLGLAREYRRGIDQHLALWDETLGQLQRTRYITPHGEGLMFELGGYAYVWYDPTVVPGTDESLPLSYHFPSVEEAYLRTSWRAGDLLIGVRKGAVVVHAGGSGVLIEPMAARDPPELAIKSLADDGKTALLRCADAEGTRTLEIKLERAERRVTMRRKLPDNWTFWCHTPPTQQDNSLSWPDGARFRVTKGHLESLEPAGYGPRLATGFLKLKLADPAHRDFPQVTIRGADAGGAAGGGEIAIEINLPAGK